MLDISNRKKLSTPPGLKGQEGEVVTLEFRGWVCSAGNEASLGKLGPQRRHGHQKRWPKPGEKERRALASSYLLHLKLLPMTLIGQTNQKPIGREARPVCFAETNLLLYKTEQGKQNERDLRAKNNTLMGQN